MNEPAHLDRRTFLTGAGLTALGLALPAGLTTACSSGSSADSLSLWMDIAGAANQRYFDQKVVGAFEKAHPDLHVKTTYYKGQDLRRLVQTALQAKSGPDIVRGPSATQTLSWGRAGVLADLSAYATKWGWSNTLLSWAIEAFRADGKLWALPLRVDTMLLYYNKSLFADNNWKPPTNRDELESLAEEAHGKGIVPFGASNVDWKAASEWHMTVFWNHYAGPDALYQALTGKVRWTDPVFVESVDLLRKYFRKGWFGGGVDKYFSVPSQELGAKFGAGKVAMFPQGEWWMSQVGSFFGKAASNDHEWDWAPLPALRDEVKYPLFELGIGGSLGINAASRKRDGAAEFLNWYFGDRKAALQRMADSPATYNVPIKVGSGDVPGGIDPRSGRLLTSLNQAVETGDYGYVTWTWWPAKSDVFIYEGLEKVLTGKLTPKDYCAQLDQKFAAEAKSGAVPRIIQRGPTR